MAYILRSIFVFCLCMCLVLAKHEQYEGYSLYEVSANDIDQAKYINQLQNQIPIDIWMPTQPGRPGQFFVSKDFKQAFEMLLKSAEVEFKDTHINFKEALEREEQLLAAAASKRSKTSVIGLDFNQIHRYDVVDDYMDRLGIAFPELVTVDIAGKSVEGRPIKYLKISTDNFQDTNKPIVFLQSLLHAREWVTLPPTLYAIEKLILNVTDADLQNDVNWIILPIANPDGYEFSHTGDRFWRKNRATGYFPNDFCVGVDLNRNFDIFWGLHSSDNPCSQTFHGAYGFSEPETQAIKNILNQYADRIELYIDIHSFGSMILFGYGTGDLPLNALTLNYVGVSMANAIDRVKWDEKPLYRVGNVYHVLYAASGISSDYVQGVGVPLSYTFELPSYRNVQGSVAGFLVDPDFIEQAGYETWEGIKVGARIVSSYSKAKRV